MTYIAIAIWAAVVVIAGIKFWRYLLPAKNRRWKNRTTLSDDILDEIWLRAQSRISTAKFNLNAAVNVTMPGTLPDWRGPDTKAMSIPAHNVTVIADDPVNANGAIPFPGGGVCNGYTLASGSHWPEVHFSSKFIGPTAESNDDSLGYEFENIIINKLGYKVGGR